MSSKWTTVRNKNALKTIGSIIHILLSLLSGSRRDCSGDSPLQLNYSLNCIFVFLVDIAAVVVGPAMVVGESVVVAAAVVFGAIVDVGVIVYDYNSLSQDL